VVRAPRGGGGGGAPPTADFRESASFGRGKIFGVKTLAHTAIEPGILYFGTPVVLISSSNEDGSANLAPMSSAFWLGWRAMLGLGARSKTAQNLLRTRECVLNLPSDALAPAVDRLALTTGSDPVPAGKASRGYFHVADKFSRAGLTPVASSTVAPPRVAECPVAMEAVVEAVHPVADEDPSQRGGIVAVEVRVQRVLVHPEILVDGSPDHIDPDAWRPLIMSFQKFYGLGSQVHPSTLARIPERMYRGPDIERARSVSRG
jgi:flavin reductase (DIM6/NTAB) family NADH-FMN oxidoreductase RutF